MTAPFENPMDHAANLYKQCQGRVAAIVGDFVYDQYVRVDLLPSPESGSQVPDSDKLRAREYLWCREDTLAGGAGIVAKQLTRIGYETHCFGVAGTDASGVDLVRDLQENLELTGLEVSQTVQTPMRLRFLTSTENGYSSELPTEFKLRRDGYGPNAHAAINGTLKKFCASANRFDLVVLCDFYHGFFTDDICRTLGRILTDCKCVVVLKTRKWAQKYGQLPLDTIFVDAAGDVLDAEGTHRLSMNVSLDVNKSVLVVRNMRLHGCAISYVENTKHGVKEVIATTVHEPITGVGGYSVLAALASAAIDVRRRTGQSAAVPQDIVHAAELISIELAMNKSGIIELEEIVRLLPAEPHVSMTCPRFDVFLIYNREDETTVTSLANALKDRGLRVWLDKWELAPGRLWQDAIAQTITTCNAAAVCVGENGVGPWEEHEMRALIRRFVSEKKRGNAVPVIPILLPGAPANVQLPVFLEAFAWVDLRNGLQRDAIERLHWGISGTKPHS